MHVAQEWPQDWKESTEIWISFLREWGCDYLTQVARPPGWNGTYWWPADFDIDLHPCVEGGWYFPLKPLSIFCPISCGCYSGDAHCPGTCRNRTKPVGGQEYMLLPHLD